MPIKVNNDTDDGPLSLSAKAYLIANSLQLTTNRLFLLFIGIFGYIFFAILIAFFSSEGIEFEYESDR